MTAKDAYGYPVCEVCLSDKVLFSSFPHIGLNRGSCVIDSWFLVGPLPIFNSLNVPLLICIHRWLSLIPRVFLLRQTPRLMPSTRPFLCRPQSSLPAPRQSCPPQPLYPAA